MLRLADLCSELIADALEALQAEIMDLRGLLAETVPDPEYRKCRTMRLNVCVKNGWHGNTVPRRPRPRSRELRRLLVIADE